MYSSGRTWRRRLLAAFFLALFLVLTCDALPSYLYTGQRYPDVSEEQAAGAIRVKILRRSPRFARDLIRNRNSYVSFACSDCRYMSLRAASKLDSLVAKVRRAWGWQVRVRVLLAWTENNVVGQPRSLHYEGKSLAGS